MKRYRLFNFDLDSRASVLGLKIREEWGENVKNLHIENKKKVEELFRKEFGELNWEEKSRNIQDLGSSPISIIAFHNKFFKQVRDSFVIGSYFPSLTGVCSLAERILNYLVLVLRTDYSSTPEYKKIYKQKSFTDWDLMIDTLKTWDILLPNVIANFKDLKMIRNNNAIHFDPNIEQKDRNLALKAIRLMSEIIGSQFGFYGTQPWFITNTKGSFYIKKSWESKPFIKRIYIPNCVYVGPFHTVTMTTEIKMKTVDKYPYENKEVTDEEFVVLLDKAKV